MREAPLSTSAGKLCLIGPSSLPRAERDASAGVAVNGEDASSTQMEICNA
jgi:hypothetical protein